MPGYRFPGPMCQIRNPISIDDGTMARTCMHDPRTTGLMRGGTLPYYQALELIKCVQIMGQNNVSDCYQMVLGETNRPLNSKGLRGQGSTHGPRLKGWPRTITWQEFRAISTRPSGENEDAQIETTVVQPNRVSIVQEQRRLRLGNYEGTLQIVRNNSWVVATHKTEKLLEHEQGHFDITGLCARDLMKALGNLRADTAEELQQEVTRLYEAYDAWGDKLSEQYDEETNRSRNEAAQRDWNARIRTAIQQGTSLGTLPP